ncbi:MAG: hypothetical protein AABZ15_03495 [Nitrospirota bacterium]
MFAGHIGAGLAIGSAERRVNIGVFIFAAVLIDFMLWLFVLLGWESVIIPADFTATHQPEFVFPFSHGLLAGLAWSALAGTAAYFYYRRLEKARSRAAVLIAAAVFSHWLLDALVHVPELPVAGADSVMMGLGLWQSMAAALTVETLIAAAGLYIFLSGAHLSRARRIGLTVLCLVVIISTVIGMTVAPPPPSVIAMAVTSLITIVVVCVLAGWLGRRHAS